MVLKEKVHYDSKRRTHANALERAYGKVFFDKCKIKNLLRYRRL